MLLLLVGCRAPIHDAQQLDDGHWFKPTDKPVISSPAVFDVDEDGVLEIAIGSWDGYLYLLDRQLDDWSGWPQHSHGGFFSSPAVVDLDGDGALEIVASAETGEVFAWRSDGQAARGFPVDLGYRLWASPTVLEGSRLAIGSLEQMVLLDGQGQWVPGWPRPMLGWPDATAAYVPGLLVVATLTPGDPSQGWLYAWGEDGRVWPGFPIEFALDSDSSPALADLDADGQWWIILGDDAGWLHVLDTQAQARAGFPVRTAGPGPGPTPTPHPPGGNVFSIEASPAVGDLDNDGRLEIAIGSWDGRMYVWDDAGRLLPGWPIQLQDQIISSAALVDLDEDERLDIVVGCKDGRLYGWTVQGETLPGFPYVLGAPVFSSPWVGDLEGDGRADIVVGANNGIHVLVDVGSLGQQAWPTFHQNSRRTGAAP